MSTLAQREKARGILFAASRPQSPPVGSRALAWARATLDGPLDFDSILEVVGDAEARYDQGYTDDSLAKTIDRTIRGEGVEIRIEIADFQSKPHYLSFVNGRPGFCLCPIEKCQVNGTVLVKPIVRYGKLEGFRAYRAIPLDLAIEKFTETIL